MEKGYRIENELPSGFSPDYDSFLFNQPEHIHLQGDDWKSFYLVRTDANSVVAKVSFYIDGDKAFSPFRAPFGSFVYSRHILPIVLYQFVQQCEIGLRKLDVTSIKITEPPLFYRTSGELLQNIFFNLGYSVSRAELSSGIRIDAITFEEKIDSWEKRKLKIAKSKGLVYKALPIAELANVYEFMLDCRKQKGYSLSMTREEIKKTVEVFKDSFLLFGAFSGKELASASIAIRVTDHILYNFYSDHKKKFDAISPAVLLISGMYKYCLTHQIPLLDLGTSALDDRPNFGLLDFKLRLGAVPSMKLTFEKKLL